MKKIMCVLAAAAMMSFCFVGCGNDNNKNSAVENASKAVSDVGSQIATIASDVVGDGTVSDTDGIIGNDENGTSDNNRNNVDATDNTNINETQHNTDVNDELM